jgi:predicted neuraminidase
MTIGTSGVGAFVMSAVITLAGLTTPDDTISVVSREFVYTSAPFPSAHASTIVETDDGLVAAWFGGTAEKHPDVAIWSARRDRTGWSPPMQVANGVQADGHRFPTWNPVLVQLPHSPLLLFYKVGPSPSEWWGMVTASDDKGRTWATPRRLPDGILGPIRAKPVLLEDGTLLAGSSTEDHGWQVHMETMLPKDEGRGTRDEGSVGASSWLAWLTSPAAWTRTEALNVPDRFSAIQPTILVHSATSLQILCRTEQRVIADSWSSDGGRTWSPLKATTLPNPSAGIDAISLADGRFLLAYNPSSSNRHTLAVSASADGVAWSPAFAVEDGPGEYSYPAMIVTRDGLVHLTYTWRRTRIRHVTLQVGHQGRRDY